MDIPLCTPWIPPSLALFISCVSISCLYGFRRLEYSASCVSPSSETENFRLWAECLGEGNGSCWTLTWPDCLIGCLHVPRYSAHNHSPGGQPGLLPALCLINRYRTDLTGQISPGLSWPIRTRTLYLFSLSSWRTKANKAGVLLGIFITLHDHPECERWDGLNYVQYTHRRLHILV